ncbi:hypothetical protein A8B74_17065 [Sulfitobacter geojensis]|jgi:hypothetical protein|nr:hypothetical protein A8B74_17065 [Sulfitobacter geojensis]
MGDLNKLGNDWFPRKLVIQQPTLNGSIEAMQKEMTMSAPDTNIEKQEENHKASLFGVKGAIGFGALMLVLVIGFTMANSDDPDGDLGLNPENGAAAETAVTGTASD